ncbi:pantoate--beta-alanine ligase [Hoyosella subflava]|uniref:Pantothenate synthetase n=1 Tax=Hoyosella subflava (strain DSM 45089 / JCM 17490 / NBRC 109087 / DQS3-9A1) TaxID=443218 RepID=F6EGV6_HOYSD|nr:pantoate--beta-alanine ligase [Hoyosella subflava]AEF38780.1 Pantothenate synthetase [Hoyosella subflava DQS3-9A1]
MTSLDTSARTGFRGDRKLYSPGELRVHSDPAQISRITKALRGVGRQIVLVPTMGALHDGHLELVRQAKRTPNSVVVVSIFVNPLQFGVNEDLDKYPRTLDADLELLRPAGVELVFAPSVGEMYPDGRRTMVHPGPLGEELDGESRPGHFAGMLTVVAKLLLNTNPHAAFFGEKDYQQLTLIRQMERDLGLGVRIVGVPTVREADGLAMSSRNRFLDERQRTAATVLSAALVAGAHAGHDGPSAVLAAARKVLSEEPLIELDYLELRSSDLGAVPPEGGPSRLLIAARLGTTRLIDNVGLVVSPAAPARPASSKG